jgi:integrase
MDDGSILDRSGKAYKPSVVRGYRQVLHAYVFPMLGDHRLDDVRRADVQDLVDQLRRQGLSPSTIHNVLDPVRVIFRRAVRRDEVLIDPTRGLELPAVRGQRDRIESPQQAQRLLDALPPNERPLWTVAMFAGLRRGELLGLRWSDVDLGAGVIRVVRGWDMYAGAIQAKSTAAVRAVPMAFPVRRELRDFKLRTGRDGDDLVFGRTAREPFFPSTVRARAVKAWRAVGVEPMTLHEARHCAISFFIASGLDLKQVSTWAGHSDIRVTLNRYGHVVPGSERQAAERLSAYLSGPTVAQTVAHPDINAKTGRFAGTDEYRYRDSNPGFRRERANGRSASVWQSCLSTGKSRNGGTLQDAQCSGDVPVWFPRGLRPHRPRAGTAASGHEQVRQPVHEVDKNASGHRMPRPGSRLGSPIGPPKTSGRGSSGFTVPAPCEVLPTSALRAGQPQNQCQTTNEREEHCPDRSKPSVSATSAGPRCAASSTRGPTCASAATAVR